MKISVKTVGFDRVGRKIEEAGEKAAHTLAVEVAKDTEMFAPSVTKSLSNRTKVEKGDIIYPGPYARYLYNGKLMVSSTGSAWAKRGEKKTVKDKDLVFNKSVHSSAQAHWFDASKAMNKEKWIRVAKKAMERELGGK